MENKYITFCLRLDKMKHISKNDFRSISQLTACLAVKKLANTELPYHLNLFMMLAHIFYFHKIFLFAL